MIEGSCELTVMPAVTLSCIRTSKFSVDMLCSERHADAKHIILLGDWISSDLTATDPHPQQHPYPHPLSPPLALP